MSGFQSAKKPSAFGHRHEYKRPPPGAGYPHGRECHYCGGRVSSAASAQGQAVVFCGGGCGKEHEGYMFAICETCSDALWKSEEKKP